jgi:hypothetical protein
MNKFFIATLTIMSAGSVFAGDNPEVTPIDPSSSDATGALVLLGLIALVLFTKSVMAPTTPSTEMAEPDVTPDL